MWIYLNCIPSDLYSGPLPVFQYYILKDFILAYNVENMGILMGWVYGGP